MKLSTNVIKAMAISDFMSWVAAFTPNRDLTEFDEESQQKYKECIEKIITKIYKEV